MRDIRFKAWDSYQNKMYSWDEICMQDSKGYLTLSNLLNEFIHHIKPLEFTGLKDKNGKEIYENDILKIDGIVFKDKQPRTAVMIWDKYCHGWRMDVDAEKKVKENHLEIIGNIFENKELLK